MSKYGSDYYLEARGWLHDSERRLLYNSAKMVPEDGAAINIGVEFGASVVCLCYGNPTMRLVAIDIIGSDKLDNDNWQSISRIGGETVEFVRADSSRIDDIDKVIGFGEVDLIFVDGGHSTRQVIDDAKYARFLKPGGVIMFHDCKYSPAEKEVDAAVEKWKSDNEDMYTELASVYSIRVFEKNDFSSRR